VTCRAKGGLPPNAASADSLPDGLASPAPTAIRSASLMAMWPGRYGMANVSRRAFTC
jgi:hypothetical protein